MGSEDIRETSSTLHAREKSAEEEGIKGKMGLGNCEPVGRGGR